MSVGNSGMARVALEFFEKELDKSCGDILNKMKGLARDQKHDMNEYAGGLIAMNHLSNLRERLVKMVTQGNKTEEQLRNERSQ